MKGPSSTSDQATLPGMSNAISSPASAAGRLPSSSPTGLRTAPSGLEVAHASRLASLAKEWEQLTKDTSGRISETSSATADLQLSLANKLQARLDVNGSPEYVLTWKEQAIALGPPICALLASRRRIKDNDSTGLQKAFWRTPSTSDAQRGVMENPKKQAGEHSLNNQASKSGWPTPQVHQGPNNGQNRGKDYGGARPRMTPQNVQDLVSAWATPSSRDWKDTPGMATTGTNPDGTERQRVDQLPRQANLAGWPTPNVMSGGQTSRSGDRKDELLMGGLVKLTSGPTPSGTPAGTASPAGYLLNPRFSLWLQGFPAAWASCGERAMPSSRRSPRS